MSPATQAESPHLIDGLGEEAYWVGTPIAGAVYVLAGDLLPRVSVGGVKTESARIEKSTALARAILTTMARPDTGRGRRFRR